MYIAKRMTKEEATQKIKQELKHEKLEGMELDKKGNLIIKTKWFKYHCLFKEKSDGLELKIGESANPFILLMALSGLILLFPFIIVLILYFVNLPAKKEITKRIYEILA